MLNTAAALAPAAQLLPAVDAADATRRYDAMAAHDDLVTADAAVPAHLRILEGETLHTGTDWLAVAHRLEDSLRGARVPAQVARVNDALRRSRDAYRREALRPGTLVRSIDGDEGRAWPSARMAQWDGATYVVRDQRTGCEYHWHRSQLTPVA